MIFNRNIDIEFSKEDQHILDGQSKICNWLYNQLLSLCIDDYKNNKNQNKYLSGRNLRNQVPKLKEINNFLSTVHSSPLKNTAMRVKESFQRFFQKTAEFPKFRPWKRKWFSLFYDEPNKGFKIKDKKVIISLGKNSSGKHLHITGTLKESLKLNEGETINTFRLCKKYNKFYVCFSIEKEDIKIPNKDPETWMSWDQNHKNFMVGVDQEGTTVEFSKLKLIKYWDKKIDELKSKRDICERKSKQRTSKNGKVYYVPSKRWVRLNKALERAYQRRREQIKQALYSIAHFLAANYEKVVIGDYVPSLETAPEKNMHRSMLNQEEIGEFRKVAAWVFTKSSRMFYKEDEAHTTSDCCICGDREYKDPSIRKFICKECKTLLSRDINSAVCIALKNKLLSSSDYKGWDLSRPKYTVYWSPFSCKIRSVKVAGSSAHVSGPDGDELNHTGSTVWATLT